MRQAGAHRRGFGASAADPGCLLCCAGVLCLAPEDRLTTCFNPRISERGKPLNVVMRVIGKHNLQLADALPDTFSRFTGGHCEVSRTKLCPQNSREMVDKVPTTIREAARSDAYPGFS
jgi:hypothetical protein